MKRGWLGEAGRDARRLLRAYPSLLRVGMADMLAYRAEFLVWILSMNLPLVMMALWTAVAADGPDTDPATGDVVPLEK